MIAEKAASCGMESIALTDHGTCAGLLAFKKSCEKNKIRPIYGNELYISPFEHTRKEKIEGFKPAYHMVALAKNNTGIKNLFKLSSLAYIEGFYFRPRVSIDLLKQYSEGLIVTGGCGAGFIPQMLQQDRYKEAIEYAKRLREIFKDDFYLEVQNHGLDWQQPLKKQLFDFSREQNIPIIATQDSHYQNKEDAEMHKHITRLAAGNLEFEGSECYFKTPKEFSEMWEENELHALDETLEVAKKCKSEWEYGKTIWPVYPLPKETTPIKELRRLAEEGLYKLFPNPTKEYLERLDYELDVIEKMGFPTYFLVVQDFIRWAENNDVLVNYGRGSGAGSIVCYCTGITKLDPIKYELYFERFLSPERVSLPDLDIDYSDREKVIQYVTEKYGKDKVAQIATYSYFKPKGALRDFARTYNYPVQVGNELAKMIPAASAGFEASFDLAIKSEPKLLKHQAQDVVTTARKAEGLIKQAGIHAAGLVISDTDISSKLPLFIGKKGEIATQFDKDEVEEIGLVKFDFLGLRNLTIIKDTLSFIKKNHNKNINIYSIQPTDQHVYENIFQKGKLEGVFQFETSSGFKDLCYKVKPNSLDDLAAISALYRPGPLSIGLVDEYAARKAGKEFKSDIPKLDILLNRTASILCYQEQIMSICRELAGYTLAGADNMRRIIGKKKLDKMALEKEKFINGCIQNNIDKQKAENLFNDIEGFARYSFNAAHSYSYSCTSFITAWLKYHYPLEFYTALLNNCDNDQDKIIKYIYAAREDGIVIQPPDVNKSEVSFTNDKDNNTIIFGFEGIKGVGGKSAAELIEIREQLGGFQTLEELLTNKVKKKVINALVECGALGEITDLSREQLIENIDDLIKYYKEIEKWEEKEVKVQERLKLIEIWEKNPEGKRPRPLKNKEEPVFPDLEKETTLTKQERLRLERETLGFYLTGNPLDDYYSIVEAAQYNILDLKEGSATHKETINIPVIVSKITKIRTKTDKNMANLIVEDKTGRQTVTIFPKTWGKIKDNIEENQVYMMKAGVELTESDEEGKLPIVNLIGINFNKIEGQSISISPLMLKLGDGSEWKFIPNEDQDITKWKQASTIIKNLRRLT